MTPYPPCPLQVDLKIPPGTQPTDLLVMRGRGVKRLNGGGSSGNQVVHVKLTIPKAITKAQEAAMQAFATEEEAQKGAGSRAEQKSLLQSACDRIRAAIKAATGGGSD